jgi:hypothetical protein
MLSIVALALLAADPPKTQPAWTPKDRETVVLLGSAFIEQEARDGYLETELIRLFPNKDIRVRNLGWSGDTVHCQARSYFGPPQEGFERLRGHLQMIKPTTVICCYGANESWKGEPGIPDFRKGYEKLIDMIREATGATVVLMTPPEYLPKGNAEKELEVANVRLRRYWQEIGYIAEARKCFIRDFGTKFASLEDPDGLRLKTFANGTDLTMIGYRCASIYFWGEPPYPEIDEVHANLRDWAVLPGTGVKISNLTKTGRTLCWTQLNDRLPGCYLFKPISVLSWDGWLEKGLENSGRDNQLYELRVDGNFVERSRGAKVTHEKGPEEKQSDRLRQAIVKKNALFFHRWRPANETYLYGFRKHEQGNNGVEPPMFDKLVEQAEAEIAVLKKPVPHKYELVRVEEKR